MPETEPKFTRRVVGNGGGSGLFTVARGLVDTNIPSLLQFHPSVWDDGGSSGLLTQYGTLPSGDFRRTYIACMENDEQRMVALRLFEDRNAELEGPFKGHPVGNFIDTRLQQIYQGLDRGSKAFRALFRISAGIEPISLTRLHLSAKTKSGQIIMGESKIGERYKEINYDPKDRISRIFFNTIAEPNPKALDAIYNAEVIVFGPGSLYTSILPHLLVDQVVETILASKGRLIFVMNLMTQKAETDGYTASDHLSPFQYYMNSASRLDYILVNNNHIEPEIIKDYENEGQYQIEVNDNEKRRLKELAPKAEIIEAPLAEYIKKNHLLRHNPKNLAENILSL